MSQSTYGIHAVLNILKAHPESVLRILIDADRKDGRVKEIMTLANQQGIALDLVDGQQLTQILGAVPHQGVLAQIQSLELDTDWASLFEKQGQNTLFLILDGVQDPHNLGACLRTADATGVHAVIVPKDHACGLTPVVRKVASGGAEYVPLITVTNLAREMEAMKAAGIWLVGAAGEASQSLYEMDFKGPIAIVCGAEGTGLRRLTKEKCDFLAKIPMKGKVESLNVSVAAAVMLYEALRQRSQFQTSGSPAS